MKKCKREIVVLLSMSLISFNSIGAMRKSNQGKSQETFSKSKIDLDFIENFAKNTKTYGGSPVIDLPVYPSYLTFTKEKDENILEQSADASYCEQEDVKVSKILGSSHEAKNGYNNSVIPGQLYGQNKQSAPFIDSLEDLDLYESHVVTDNGNMFAWPDNNVSFENESFGDFDKAPRSPIEMSVFPLPKIVPERIYKTDLIPGRILNKAKEESLSSSLGMYTFSNSGKVVGLFVLGKNKNADFYLDYQLLRDSLVFDSDHHIKDFFDTLNFTSFEFSKDLRKIKEHSIKSKYEGFNSHVDYYRRMSKISRFPCQFHKQIQEQYK